MLEDLIKKSSFQCFSFSDISHSFFSTFFALKLSLSIHLSLNTIFVEFQYHILRVTSSLLKCKVLYSGKILNHLVGTNSKTIANCMKELSKTIVKLVPILRL